MITRTLFRTVPLLIVAWLSTLMTVSVLSDSAPAQLVLFPSSSFLKALPSNIAITKATALSVTLASNKPHLARVLYRHGALIVLPAGLQGCAPRG